MAKRFDPNEIEAMGGPSPEKLRDWRHRGLLEDLGENRGGRWGYAMSDVLVLGCAGLLVDQGLELGSAIELAKGGRHLLFAWLVEATPHDNHLLASRRADDEVIFVSDISDDKARFKFAVRHWRWGQLQSSDDFRYVTLIFPRVLIHDLDERFRRALLDEYGAIGREVRAAIQAEQKQSDRKR